MTMGRKAGVRAVRITGFCRTPCAAVVLATAALLPLLVLLPAAAQQAGEANVWTSQSQYPVGEKIVVRFSGLPGNASDWIAVVPADAPNDTWGECKYTHGKTTGIMEFPCLPPGRYEGRVYFDWSGTGSHEVRHRHQFTVGEGGEG